jgi:hypothetical protein
VTHQLRHHHIGRGEMRIRPPLSKCLAFSRMVWPSGPVRSSGGLTIERTAANAFTAGRRNGDFIGRHDSHA